MTLIKKAIGIGLAACAIGSIFVGNAVAQAPTPMVCGAQTKGAWTDRPECSFWVTWREVTYTAAWVCLGNKVKPNSYTCDGPDESGGCQYWFNPNICPGATCPCGGAN